METQANRWKNDVFLFEHPDHKTNIANTLQEFFQNNAPSVLDPFTTWNCYKVYIRGVLMKLRNVTKKPMEPAA